MSDDNDQKNIVYFTDMANPVVVRLLNEHQIEQVRQIIREEIKKALDEFADQLRHEQSGGLG